MPGHHGQCPGPPLFPAYQSSRLLRVQPASEDGAVRFLTPVGRTLFLDQKSLLPPQRPPDPTETTAVQSGVCPALSDPTGTSASLRPEQPWCVSVHPGGRPLWISQPADCYQPLIHMVIVVTLSRPRKSWHIYANTQHGGGLVCLLPRDREKGDTRKRRCHL